MEIKLVKKSKHFYKFEAVNMQILRGVTTKYHWINQQKKKRNAYRVLVGNPEEGRLLERRLLVQGESIDMDLETEDGSAQTAFVWFRIRKNCRLL
jgi:hypothetical protein